MITQKMTHRTTVLSCLLMSGLSVCSWAQEPRGFAVIKNLTISPYVNLEYLYDSNVMLDKDATGDSILGINPGVDLSYRKNEWGVNANAWYGYDSYVDLSDLNADRYGESIDGSYEAAKGWKLVLGQRYMKTNQDDSIIEGGSGQWRPRSEFAFNGALSYMFSEKTSATLNAGYSDLSYDIDPTQYQPLYGWQEWTVGLEIARKLSEKSNVLLSGSYQEYASDGAIGIDNNSTGYTLQAGLGSRATERIKYRALIGASMFEYAGGADQMNGWTYSVDANWVISRKVAASIAGSSFFQPSEQDANQAMQVYALSAGLNYNPMRRLSTRADLAFRREEGQLDVGNAGAVTDNLYSARLRADYGPLHLDAGGIKVDANLYCGLEYTERMSDESFNEYDRYRISLGMTFRY